MILFLLFEPLGLVGIWHRMQNYFLLWPFKHRPLRERANERAAAGRSRSSRSSIKRVITAVQGVTLVGRAAEQIVALLGTNGAGKTTTLRAISGFLGLDDARVTEGTISFEGRRIENRAAARYTRARHCAGA